MEQDYKNLSKLTDEELKSLYKEVRAERKRRNYLKRYRNSTYRAGFHSNSSISVSIKVISKNLS